MSSTFSTSSNGVGGINRKELKRPDSFTRTVSETFKGISQHSKFWVAILGGALGVGVLGALYMNHIGEQEKEAKNAFYLAERALETEMKLLAPKKDSVSTEAAQKSSPKASQKNSKTASLDSESAMESVAFKKMEVDSQFPETLKKLKEVDSKFPRSRAGFEARVRLADLYFNHGNFAKALPWYQKAVDSAPNSFEKVMALSALGYVHENLGKPQEAIQAFQKAQNLKEGSSKGDLLLAIARNYVAVHDSANARSTYDKILSEFPNTEYAKAAEVLKEQVQ